MRSRLVVTMVLRDAIEKMSCHPQIWMYDEDKIISNVSPLFDFIHVVP